MNVRTAREKETGALMISWTSILGYLSMEFHMIEKTNFNLEATVIRGLYYS